MAETATTPDMSLEQAMEIKQFIQQLDSLHRYLKGMRSDFEADWEMLIPEFRPEIGPLLWSGQTAVQHNSELFSGYGAQAARIWAVGIVGHMFYPKPRWLDVAIDNRDLMDNSQVKDYLQQWSEQLFYGFNRTNFYEMLPEVATDAASTIGYLTPVVDEKRGRLHFMHDHIGDVWIGVDALGYLDRVHREVHYSAIAAKELFGEENLSPQIRQSLKDSNNQFKMYTFVHAMFPNPDYDASREEPHDAAFLPIASVYYEKISRWMNERSGVRSIPMAWRVHKYARQWYPYSPGQCALTDVLTDNMMTKSLNYVSQMSAQPPMVMPEALKRQVKPIPNGFTFYKEAQIGQIAPLYQNALNYAVPAEERNLIRLSIDKWMSTPFFNMMTQVMQKTGQPPTAFQISRAEAQNAILLGPQVGSLINDIGNPSVDAVWDYQTRNSTVPEMPAVLEDYLMAELDRTGIARIETINEYTGILAQNQSRVIKQQNIIDALALSGMILEQYPEAQHALKAYPLMRGAMDSANIDQDTIREQPEYQEIIEQIKEDEQIAQQAALQKNTSESYKNMTGAPEEGSPVQQEG